jgi:5-methylcytosine-specific restriction endonuclease McrA
MMMGQSDEDRLARQREYQREYRRRNREKVLQSHRDYNERNRDRINAAQADVMQRQRFEGDVETFTRLEVFERDGWICGICHEPIDRELKRPDPMAVTLDHIKPVGKGGEHTLDNVQAAHDSCNRRKGGRDGSAKATP